MRKNTPQNRSTKNSYSFMRGKNPVPTADIRESDFRYHPKVSIGLLIGVSVREGETPLSTAPPVSLPANARLAAAKQKGLIHLLCFQMSSLP
jgi:hypothetical protein